VGTGFPLGRAGMTEALIGVGKQGNSIAAKVESTPGVSEKQTETTGRLVVALRPHLNSSDAVFAGNPDDADGQDEKSGARRRSNAIGRALGCFNQLWAYGYNDIDLVFDRVATRRDIAYSFRS
jgi:hypothetical protein